MAMNKKDRMGVAVVFCLLFAVIVYEYRVSVKLTPSTEGTGSDETSIQGISSKELQDISKGGGDIIIVDVRSRRAYNKGHIPGAISIPFPDITKRSNELDQDKMVVIYCESGPWSRIAYGELKELGFKNLRLLKNGIVGWKWEVRGEIEKGD